jgi:hypothetical protein
MKVNCKEKMAKMGEVELVKVYMMWGSEKGHNYVYENFKGTTQGVMECYEKYALK